MGYIILGRGPLSDLGDFSVQYNIFCRPFNYNNIIYSLQKDKACNKYGVIYSSGSRYPALQLTNNTKIPFYYDWSAAGDKYAKERLWYSDGSISGGISLVSVQISGKRVFNANSRALASYDRCSLPITFFSNGIEFHAIRFCSSYTTDISNTGSFVNKNITSVNATIVQFIKPDGTAIKAISESGWNYSILPDDTVDFGSLRQDVTEDFRTWLLENSTPEKTAKITIKEGNTTLVESGLIAPYTSITLSTLNNKTTLTTNNGDELTFDTKNNFSGLSENKIALYPTIKDGTITYFANAGEVTFYTCYKPSKPLPSNFLCSFYRCDAEENRVDKTNYLSDKHDFYITLKDEAPILGMSIFLDLTNIKMDWDIPKWNYCYLHKFNRWYFCELKSVYNNVWEFKLSEDVLMSFKDQISGLQGMVDRNQSIFDKDIPDDLILTKAYPVIEHSELSPLQDIFKPDDDMNGYYNYLIILRG